MRSLTHRMHRLRHKTVVVRVLSLSCVLMPWLLVDVIAIEPPATEQQVVPFLGQPSSSATGNLGESSRPGFVGQAVAAHLEASLEGWDQLTGYGGSWWPQCGCANPVPGSDVITSPFGPRNKSETGYEYDFHDGIDIRMDSGQTVHAIESGVVKRVYFFSPVVGWIVEVTSHGSDMVRQQRDFLAVYKHLADWDVREDDTVYKDVQSALGPCGKYGSGAHVHLTICPDNDADLRVHPLNFLHREDDLECVELPPDSAKYGGGPRGQADWVSVVALSPKSERFDLLQIQIDILVVNGSDSTEESATIDYERDWEELEAASSGYVYRLQSTSNPVTVTLKPRKLYPDSAFHALEVLVNPQQSINWLQDHETLRICVWDVLGKLSYLPTVLGEASSAGVRQGLCPSCLGNVVGGTGGDIVRLFHGVGRTDGTVELCWDVTPGADAAGVKILRAIDHGEEVPIHEGLLPLGAEAGSQDTMCFVDNEIPPSAEEVTYRIVVVLRTGKTVLDGKVVRIHSVRGRAAVPTSFALSQNWPNPFNGVTRIGLALDSTSSGKVSLEVFDILGRCVRTLFRTDAASAGFYSWEWDGCDGNGRPVASGVYLYRLVTSAHIVTKKMVLLK